MKLVDQHLAIVPYKEANHNSKVTFPMPCLMLSLFLQVFKVELPNVIHLPRVMEVLDHIDFIFSERSFYHTPSKVCCFYWFEVNTLYIHTSVCSHIGEFLFLFVVWRSSKFVDFLPRPLLKIRGRIFSKRGGIMWIREHRA